MAAFVRRRLPFGTEISGFYNSAENFRVAPLVDLSIGYGRRLR